jgi:hypothetical protein
MRKALPAILLAVSLTACREEPRSPFALWDMRAGMPFAALDSIALHDQKERFTCKPSYGNYKDCFSYSRGAFGVVQAIVDSTGRAVLISWRPDIKNMSGFGDMMAGLQIESRRVRATWNQVVMARPDPAYQAPERGESWRSTDGRWGAYIIWEAGGLAREFKVTDERAMLAWDALAARAVADSMAKVAAVPAPVAAGPADPTRLLELINFELKRLVDAQIVYHDTHREYADDLAQLQFSARPKMQISIGGADSFGWWANGTHQDLNGEGCTVWMGRPPNVRGKLASREATPECTQ